MEWDGHIMKLDRGLRWVQNSTVCNSGASGAIDYPEARTANRPRIVTAHVGKRQHTRYPEEDKEWQTGGTGGDSMQLKVPEQKFEGQSQGVRETLRRRGLRTEDG